MRGFETIFEESLFNFHTENNNCACLWFWVAKFESETNQKLVF